MSFRLSRCDSWLEAYHREGLLAQTPQATGFRFEVTGRWWSAGCARSLLDFPRLLNMVQPFLGQCEDQSMLI